MSSHLCISSTHGSGARWHKLSIGSNVNKPLSRNLSRKNYSIQWFGKENQDFSILFLDPYNFSRTEELKNVRHRTKIHIDGTIKLTYDM